MNTEARNPRGRGSRIGGGKKKGGQFSNSKSSRPDEGEVPRKDEWEATDWFSSGTV